MPGYHPDRFYPITIGQVLNERYQVATKLGFGAGSTVWLCRDLHPFAVPIRNMFSDLRNRRWPREKYVAIKVNALPYPNAKFAVENEIEIMQHIDQADPKHLGRTIVRIPSDSFILETASGEHICLVMQVLREHLWMFKRRWVGGVIHPELLKILMQQILRVVDYLHTECHIIHGGRSTWKLF